MLLNKFQQLLLYQHSITLFCEIYQYFQCDYHFEASACFSEEMKSVDNQSHIPSNKRKCNKWAIQRNTQPSNLTTYSITL